MSLASEFMASGRRLALRRIYDAAYQAWKDGQTLDERCGAKALHWAAHLALWLDTDLDSVLRTMAPDTAAEARRALERLTQKEATHP